MQEQTKEQKLWFAAKCYGWGWTPATWQGWLATAIYGAFVAVEIIQVDFISPSVSEVFVGFVAPLVLVSALFIMLCYAKGEKPKWRWGDK